MKLYKYTIFLLLSLSLTRCDLEKLTGYNHDAPPIPNSARIYGRITNTFSGEPVLSATIKIGEQATFSDSSGAFEFYYYLAEDDERNKLNLLTISARNYATIDTMIVVFPENKIDKKLIYAAPIVRRIALVGGICQAEIYDYQGYEDITYVYGSFYYTRIGERMWSLNTTQTLIRVDSDSTNTAYFQAIVPEEIEGYGLLAPFFKVFARDKEAHSDSTSYANSGVDSLLFPVIR